MLQYPFEKRPEMLVFCCTHVLEGKRPITSVSHHFDDNNWIFACDCEHSDTDAVITSIGELLELDKTVSLLCDLPVGHCATRRDRRFKWKTQIIAGEKHYTITENGKY